MTAGSTLLLNLAVVLGLACLGAIVAARLRVSVILGYILAGIAIGPYTPGFHGDLATVAALADIGVILLMFTVGVDLSLQRLLERWRLAIFGGAGQVALMITGGLVTGALLGWPLAEAFCFGAAVAISSSIVAGKLLGERGETGSLHGQIALALSAVQDLATVALVILLRAFAGSEGATPLEVLLAVGKAALFLFVLVPLGSRILPWVFERVARLRNRELFALSVAAVALAVASISTLFGLSLALGAFAAGIVVSESDLSHRILATVGPLRDVFAGIFFVSIGMLLDPLAALDNLPLLGLVALLILVVKPALITALARLGRYSWRTSLLAGAALANSAEFSFLLLTTGLTLGVLSNEVFALVLTASLLSVVLAPATYRGAGWLSALLTRRKVLLEEAWPATSSGRPHAVILGYGRVGQVIGNALARRGFSFIAVDEDAEVVRRLRAQGIPAVLGEADNPYLLDQLGLDQARLLIIALPDALATRRVVEHVRSAYPRLPILARTHSLEEQEHLLGRGVQAVVGELELALEMTRAALRRFGVSATEIQSLLQRLRAPAEPAP
ncbi:MAG: sodium/hydrogen exchanger [Dehalococcoidia bacterium]|nr:MAG: sodium/hydrogen exchanger [Dehalococcoidia bacterium]